MIYELDNFVSNNNLDYINNEILKAINICPSILNTKPNENTPHLYSSLHDTNNPPNVFRDTDLRQEFLNKQQMKARMISPSIPTYF